MAVGEGKDHASVRFAQSRGSVLRVDDEGGHSSRRMMTHHEAGRSGPRGPEPSSEAYFHAASTVLAASPSVFERRTLTALLSRHYGLSGQIEILSSEAEHTAQVTLPGGERLILKASMQPQAVESFRFQSAAIAALDAAEGFIAPRILRTMAGASMFEADGIAGYLQTRVAGSPLHREPARPELLHRTGCALGRLDLALQGHDLPAVHRPVLWHIGCWPRLCAFQPYVPRQALSEAVGRAMADYIRDIEPNIRDLAWQVVHNDPSPFNTLATDRDIAFIDFGDGVFGPRIQDLAIAASHVVADPSLPLGGAEHLVAGYSAVLPLSELEAHLLVGLMKARQAALILINHWRAHLFPSDAVYIKKNVARAERGLFLLNRLSASDGRAAVTRSAGLS